MSPSEFVPGAGRHDRRRHHVDPMIASATVKPPKRKRLGCSDIARKRAVRYARRHRIARPFLPFITALILIDLIFERRSFPALLRMEGKTALDGITMGRASMPGLSEDQDIDQACAPRDTGGAISGDPEPRYRLPADFFVAEREIVQIVAFLVRSRGKLDTDPVKMKWEILDRASLPLAVFLREIEATAAWDDLEKEIADASFEVPTASGIGLLSSPRHRKILKLIPDWSRLGEQLLSLDPVEEATPVPTPNGNHFDDPNRKPPKP